MCVWELDMVLQVLNVTYFITNTVIRMPGKMQHLRSCLPLCQLYKLPSLILIHSQKCKRNEWFTTVPGGTEYPVHLQKHWWCHVLLLFNFPSVDRLLGIKHGKHKKNTAKKHCAGGRETTHTTDFKTFVS